MRLLRYAKSDLASLAMTILSQILNGYGEIIDKALEQSYHFFMTETAAGLTETLSAQEVMAQIANQLEGKNSELEGSLYVKISGNPTDGTSTAYVFDAASQNTPGIGSITTGSTTHLVFVEGIGFRKIVAPSGQTGAVNQALIALRMMLQGGENRFVGEVKRGHNQATTTGREIFVLPDGLIAKGVVAEGETSRAESIRYRIATTEDIEQLLPVNIDAAHKRHEILVKERLEAQRTDPNYIARNILPRLQSLMQPPTPSPNGSGAVPSGFTFS